MSSWRNFRAHAKLWWSLLPQIPTELQFFADTIESSWRKNMQSPQENLHGHLNGEGCSKVFYSAQGKMRISITPNSPSRGCEVAMLFTDIFFQLLWRGSSPSSCDYVT
jgi:hypothetical protein